MPPPRIRRIIPGMTYFRPLFAALGLSLAAALAQSPAPVTAVRAAHALDVQTGQLIPHAVILIRGQRITAIGANLAIPAGARVIDLGSLTLLPGLIDAHVHLFLHPGNETLQTVDESTPQRTIQATLAAKADLLGGFTSVKDMGTEGAGDVASTAVRQAINRGQIPGPRVWTCGNAISILGGHEDAFGFNPALHIPSNADVVQTRRQLIHTIRLQIKDGATFIKIYETGRDRFADGIFSTPYQFTEPQLAAAVQEAARLGTFVSVHAQGEPGTLYAAQAGVASLDHATQLSPRTIRIAIRKHIFAVPTFTVFKFFADHAPNAKSAANQYAELAYKARQFRLQLKAGMPMAMGSDVGPFPHGTQATEFVLMVHYGMAPLEAIQAGTINAATLLRAQANLGSLTPGKYADIIAVQGNPLQDISALTRVKFVMKGGTIYKQPPGTQPPVSLN